MKLGVGEFKARCLALIDEVHLDGGEIVLTKWGRPMAKVVSIPATEAPFDRSLVGTVEISGDYR